MNFKQLTLSAAALIFSMNVSANLVVNGSFEDPTLAAGTWSVFSSIPGWTVQNGSGIEVQNNVVIPSYDGDQHVELDSYSNSSMYQLVQGMTIGENYQLSFAYAPRVNDTFSNSPGPTVNTNGINVYFGTQTELINLDGIFTNTQSGWSIFSATVVASAEEMYLTFEADGTSDTYGGFIDNVVVIPEPSVIALFGLGLAGLGFSARRRQAK